MVVWDFFHQQYAAKKPHISIFGILWCLRCLAKSSHWRCRMQLGMIDLCTWKQSPSSQGRRYWIFGVPNSGVYIMTINNSLCTRIVANRDQKYQNILHKGSLVLMTSLVQFHDPWCSSLQSLHCRVMTNDYIFFRTWTPVCYKEKCVQGWFC